MIMWNNLSDAYENYVFDAGYIVSECKKGVYKIDGVTLLDKNFDTKDVTVDSFINVVSSISKDDSKIYVGTLEYIWIKGYEYYITKACNINKVLSSIDYIRIRKYFSETDFIIVGLKLTGLVEGCIIANCNRGFVCNSTYCRPKSPAMVVQDAEEFIGVYLDQGKIVFRPYEIGLNNCRLNSTYSILSKDCKSRGFSFTKTGGLVGHYIPLSGLLSADGAFLRMTDYCTVDKSRDIADTLIFPNGCKYIYGNAIVSTGQYTLENVVFSKSIDKYIAPNEGMPLLGFCKNLKCLCFSHETPLKTVIKLCRDSLFDRRSEYYSKMTMLVRGSSDDKFMYCIANVEILLRYSFRDISIKFY